jgi:hypothetical protein
MHQAQNANSHRKRLANTKIARQIYSLFERESKEKRHRADGRSGAAL